MSATEGAKNYGMAYAEMASTRFASGLGQGSYSATTNGSHGVDGTNQPGTPYRWTPCPEWETTGRCKYKDACYRRHGESDHRVVPQGWESKRSTRPKPQLTQSPIQSGTSAQAGLSSTTQQAAHWSPDAYDSDLAMSPPSATSPTALSPPLTSPTLSQRVSLSSSPHDAFDHHTGPIMEKPWIWQPCRHWQESGSCRYGDSCKYRHGPEDKRERPAPRPTGPTSGHGAGHMMRSASNSSMESGSFSTGDPMAPSRPNISLQPIGAQITSPNASMGTLPPYQSPGMVGPQGNAIWDLFAPTMGRMSPPLGENTTQIIQSFNEHLRTLSLHHPVASDMQHELNALHIQSLISIQLQREAFLPFPLQESMRSLLQSLSVASNPHEWQFALVRVLNFLEVLLDHLFNKFVSVSISSPSSSFGQLPVDIPSKLSLVQPYIGGRLSGSISELYDLGTRAAAGLFAPSQEEVITILEQLRRVAASTSKSV